MSNLEKLLAARDLLASTKRTLQILDDRIDVIKQGRIAIQPAADVSTEHRTAWFGAVDDNDGENGIFIGNAEATPNEQLGFNRPITGTIRVQEDAAFVVTRIMVAGTLTRGDPEGVDRIQTFTEDPYELPETLVALKDGNTGRNLTPGLTVGPVDQDRGAVPLTTLSSYRKGLGSNFKNSLFSEFVIPRAGTVKVTLWNMTENLTAFDDVVWEDTRIFVTLFGYKVFGA